MTNTIPQTTTGTTGYETAFFGHPRGLATLFFTEFWERFSYYGLRALLVLFMTATTQSGGLGYDAAKAGAIYGLYTAMVYLLALPGGWLADRLLGQRRAVLFGSIIIASGHFTMAVESEVTFFLGLVLVAVGTGLLKPNMTVMVGALYTDKGARRDAGFSIFYMGINLGAFIAPFVCGSLGEQVNWHLGFGVAGIGMVLGIVQYVLGSKYLGEAGLNPAQAADAQRQAKQSRQAYQGLFIGLGVVLVGLSLIATGTIPVNVLVLADFTGGVIVGTALLYLGYILFAGGLEPEEAKKIWVVAILFLFSALFWAGFEQAGSSLNLFAAKFTDRMVGDFEISTTWLQAINPVLIITMAPVFAWLWVALGSKVPSLPAKFALGLILVSVGFLVIATGSLFISNGAKVSPLWLVATYFFLTAGELCLSPVGLCAMTKLAPQRLVSQMMGVWFISISLGNLLAGRVAGLFESLPLPGLFGAVAATTVVAGLFLALLVKPIKGLMGDVR